MRRFVEERPRVAALWALTVAGLTVAAIAIATSVTDAAGERQLRADRAEHVTAERTAQLERVRSDLRVASRALARTARRAERAERRALRRGRALERWRLRADQAERRLERAGTREDDQ